MRLRVRCSSSRRRETSSAGSAGRRERSGKARFRTGPETSPCRPVGMGNVFGLGDGSGGAVLGDLGDRTGSDHRACAGCYLVTNSHPAASPRSCPSFFRGGLRPRSPVHFRLRLHMIPRGNSAQKSYSPVVISGLTPAKLQPLVPKPAPRPPSEMMRDFLDPTAPCARGCNNPACSNTWLEFLHSATYNPAFVVGSGSIAWPSLKRPRSRR